MTTLHAIESLDAVSAAGLLSRMALSIDDEGNPAAKAILPFEDRLRDAVLRELRAYLGVGAGELSLSEKARLTEALDQATDELLGHSDDQQAFERMAQKGTLPKDLYLIEPDSPLRDLLGKEFDAEFRRIKETILEPDQEEHCAPDGPKDAERSISLFSRFFKNKYPLRSFTLLVVTSRRGLVLVVNQAWRIYHDIINTETATSLMEILRRFAEKFGVEISTPTGIKSKLIFQTNCEWKGIEVNVSREKKSARTEIFGITHGVNSRRDYAQAALAIAVDGDKYRSLLKSRGG